jgi:apolipoprotein N-acyltransferase
VGFFFLLFANGMKIVPVAAWIAPVFIVRFLRTQKPALALPLAAIVNAAAFYFQWSAAFKDAGALFTLSTAAFGLIVFVPYVIDRVFPRRALGFAGTLVLPAAWVVLEYALSLGLPLGTFFNLGYTQSSNTALLQIISVTGVWSISFLILWFATVVNYAWEAGFDLKKAGRGLATYAIVLLAVMTFGGLRLALFRPMGPTVQVAVLTTNVDGEPLPDAETEGWQRLVSGSLTAEDRRQIQAAMGRINGDLLARTRIQARAGARIVTWSEFNAQTFSDGEVAFLARAQAVAREERIYLAFPLEVTEPDMARRAEPGVFQVNKSVMITPDGEIAYQYLKHNLLIGPETTTTVRGPRVIDSIQTPYGRIASVICLDMEYPDFMRLAGNQRVDIMLSGAIDGTASTRGNPLHSIMASYRTIEEGFSLGRAGFYGQNIAVDYQGRIIGAANHYTAGDRTVVAHLPIQGVRTAYSALGDFFPWMCGASLIVLLIIASLRRRHTDAR